MHWPVAIQSEMRNDAVVENNLFLVPLNPYES